MSNLSNIKLEIEKYANESNFTELQIVEKLEKYCLTIFNKAKDRRKAPNPGSVGYYLSYFWQIHDNSQWPILYTSQINSYKELDLWKDKSSQKETYSFFYNLNQEIKQVLESHNIKNQFNGFVKKLISWSAFR